MKSARDLLKACEICGKSIVGHSREKQIVNDNHTYISFAITG